MSRSCDQIYFAIDRIKLYLNLRRSLGKGFEEGNNWHLFHGKQ